MQKEQKRLRCLICVYQVKALYDFDGDTENSEISFSTGEILTVTNKVR